MKYLSLCSGIEAATVAWEPLGWKPWAFSEIEDFPCQVLKYHYHDIPNFGDMTKYKEWSNERIDVIVGGTPCQSFSLAGLRKGLDDPRGNLMLVYLGVVEKYKPRWIVWENVPGVLSSNGGKDFGTFLGAFGELGYGWSYRVLDAQYFGVPQRRRRVFVVGCRGDQPSSAAVLFESSCLSRNSAKGGKKRKENTRVSGTLFANGGGTTRPGGINEDTTYTLDRSNGQAIAYGVINLQGSKSNCITIEDGTSYTLAATHNNMHGIWRTFNDDITRTLSRRMDSSPCIGREQDILISPFEGVRRFTPLECERLQGFPDNYTAIGSDNKRYKAIGNSMAVPVMRWIGNRIDFVDSIKEHK